MIESFIPVDPDSEETQDAELVDASLIRIMTQTDGWKLIKTRLEEESQNYITTLLLTPATNENMAEIARLQANANGCRYVLNLVQHLASVRKDV